jgi:hypothetical protein
MEDYIYVDPPALNERAVKAWLQLAVDFVETLPRKSPPTARARRGISPATWSHCVRTFITTARVGQTGAWCTGARLSNWPRLG